MRKIAGLLFLMSVALAVSIRCSGGNEVTGPGGGHQNQAVTPDPGTHPRPTPNPCRQNPSDCD